MDDTIRQEKDYLKVGIQEALLCSEYVLKYLENGPERAQHLQNMEGLVRNYCLLDHHLQIRPAIVTKMAYEENMRRAQEENTEASNATIDYGKQISDKVNSAMQKVKVDDHSKMKDYKKKVTILRNKADGIDDDELMVTDESNNFIDPLSKKELVDPVISARCLHKYSRKSIMDHLKIHSQCPYVGCRVKNLTAADLEEDVITAHTLRRMHMLRQ